MSPDERAFPQFIQGMARGLYKAVLTDPDVFLLALTGILLGSSRKHLRGIGTSFAVYVTFRRLDRYVDVGVQLVQYARITKEQTHV